jgi:tetratricopeptide (TPR) repeat protein
MCFKESAAAWLAIGAAWTALRPNDDRKAATVVAARGAAYLAAFTAYLALRTLAVGWARHDVPFVDNPLVNVSAGARALNAVLLFARYLAKMLWPRTLSVEYGFDQIGVIPAFPWGALGALFIAIGFVAAVVELRRRGHGTAAFLTVFVPCAFAVTGNLAFPIGTIFAERLAYLPLAGLCGLAALALAAIPRPVWRAAFVLLLLVACGARTVARSRDYRDLASLSEATAAASPRAVKALFNAGRTRLRQGHADTAVPLLEQAVSIWPDYANAWRLLAEAYAASGDAARADGAMRREREAASRAGSADEPL